MAKKLEKLIPIIPVAMIGTYYGGKSLIDIKKLVKNTLTSDNLVKCTKVIGNLGLTEKCLDTLRTEFRNSYVYKINISTLIYMLYDFISSAFKHIPESLTWDVNIFSEEPQVEVRNISGELLDVNATFVDYAIVENIPLRISIQFNCGDDGDCGIRSIKTAFIETLRVNDYPNRLKEILKREIKLAHKKECETQVHSMILVSCKYNISSHWVHDYVPRNFDNVFMPDAIVDSIKNGIDKFVSSADWYNKHALPYHYGIMLYGSPGMGKSSLAQAISNHMNSKLFIVSGDEILDLPDLIRSKINTNGLSKNEYNIILIEDIDCGLEIDAINDRSESDNKKKKSGLASVLNCIDGIGAPQNTIYIFTTNHIEKLDPALIRPGRIDLSLEIPAVNNEIFGKFMSHHFPEYKVPKTLKIKDGISCASLQVMVMEGKTPDELVKFVKS